MYWFGIVLLVAALVGGPVVVRNWWRAWHRQWEAAKHTYRRPDPEPGELERAWFGSMNLDDEREMWADRNAGRFDSALGGPGSDHTLSGVPGLPTLADWREQTAANLSPESLERLCGPEQPQERERSPGNENRDRGADSGLGGLSSLPPGPDPAVEPGGPEGARDTGQSSAWLDAQLEVLFAWVRAQWEAAA